MTIIRLWWLSQWLVTYGHCWVRLGSST